MSLDHYAYIIGLACSYQNLFASPGEIKFNSCA